MTKSRVKTKTRTKKVGRPKSTGSGLPTMVRLHKPQLKAIDAWIGATDISRPEAIRQLVQWALEHTKPVEPPPIKIVQRARENERRAT